MTELELFQAVLDLPDPASRAEFLDRACAGDADRRTRVDALLRSHEADDSFLATPAAGPGDAGDALHAQTADVAAADDDGAPPRSSAEHPHDEFRALLGPAGRPDSLGSLGHYEMLQLLGRGGFGVVFRAFDKVLERVVAVKLLDPRIAAGSPARKRFLREARASAAVRHENVVQIHEVGEQPLPYLVMEFIPGETLQSRLDRHGPLDVLETLRIGRQIAEGLAAAHLCDLIHRDIKPGNVLLEGGTQRVRLTDFGLARAADDASMTRSGAIAGTPLYMAPEQALGATLDQRADLFSFGSVLYQMVAGRPPFRASNTLAVLKRVAEEAPRPIREIIPETPQWLCNIIGKLHAKRPEDRFGSAREVSDVLADCETQFKANARLKDFSRIPRTKPDAPPARTRRIAVTAAAVLLLSAAALAVTESAGVTRLFHAEETAPVAVAPAAPLLPAAVDPAAAAPIPSETWVQLFNGKDLTGWKTHPDMPGDWKVVDGVLVGSKSMSYLFTEANDIEEFHLRVEVIINRGGDSGIFFRTPFAMRQGRTADQLRPGAGYEIELQNNPAYTIMTGSIWDSETTGPPVLLARAEAVLPRDGVTWSVLEIISRGNRITTKLDGLQIADAQELPQKYPAGHLLLQVFSPKTVVRFRKIEIARVTAEK